jgi:hypothetical protein
MKVNGTINFNWSGNSTSLISNKYTNIDIQYTFLHIHRVTKFHQVYNSTSIQINHANIHRAHKQLWHLSSYAMRLDTTSICMWYRSPQGRHLRYICIIVVANMNTKYSSSPIWIKKLVVANMDIQSDTNVMNAWTYDSIIAYVQQ